MMGGNGTLIIIKLITLIKLMIIILPIKNYVVKLPIARQLAKRKC